MPASVLVPIAEGIEEIEAVTIVDVMRRAGAEVTVASVGDLQVTASRGVRLVGDCRISDCLGTTYDLIALPGGMPGAEHLRDSGDLVSMLVRQRREGRWYAAICASPAVVLQAHGLLVDRRATAHPGFVDRLADTEGVESRVVVDGNCVTSRGPGTALEFALALVDLLFGRDRAEEVARAMLARPDALPSRGNEASAS